MIFVTVGTQGPFDRLISAMDEIALLIPNIPIVAQTSSSSYMARNMKTFEFITPLKFNALFSEAELIVSHAGMGTIISALEVQKPIIVFPKLSRLGEHRNDHQLETAKKFEALNYVNVVYERDLLKLKVLSLLHNDLKPLHKIGQYASQELIDSLQNFIESNIYFEFQI